MPNPASSSSSVLSLLGKQPSNRSHSVYPHYVILLSPNPLAVLLFFLIDLIFLSSISFCPALISTFLLLRSSLSTLALHVWNILKINNNSFHNYRLYSIAVANNNPTCVNNNEGYLKIIRKHYRIIGCTLPSRTNHHVDLFLFLVVLDIYFSTRNICRCSVYIFCYTVCVRLYLLISIILLNPCKTGLDISNLQICSCIFYVFAKKIKRVNYSYSGGTTDLYTLMSST